MRLIDSHCHLNDIIPSRDLAKGQIDSNSVKKYALSEKVLPVTVGYSHSSNIKNIEIAKRTGIPFVLGIAPQTAIKEGTEKIELWINTIRTADPLPFAIGEIGLDYHWAKTRENFEKEKVVFDKMLLLADELDLPIVIHARKAESDVLQILEERGFRRIMMHFFSGNEEEAKYALKLGAYISIPPVKSKERKNIIKSTPLDKLLAETDSPYVARTPENVQDSVAYIAEIKQIEFEEVAKATVFNARKFFGIEEFF